MKLNFMPLEVYLKIISYLPASDVMKIRLVCKQWNALINSEFKFKRLRCEQFRRSSQPQYDFHFESMKILLDFLNYASHDPKFSRVKYLEASFGPEYTEIDDAFDFLKLFKETLEETNFTVHTRNTYKFVDGRIKRRKRYRNNRTAIQRKQFVVCLDRLVKANFYFEWQVFESKVSVTLNLPKLIHLTLKSFYSVTISHPQNLRTLVIFDLAEKEVDYSQFKNLTAIYLFYGEVLSVSESFIQKLPRLR